MNKYHIPSIANTCEIFNLLTSSRKAMNASEISKELNLPRTSVFRILKTLETEGMLYSLGKKYTIGHRLINLGLQMISNIPERQLCVPILQKLTKKTEESSHFTILSGAQALFIEVCDSSHALRVARRTGALIDLHCSASGKCLLAYASENAREELIKRIEFSPRTHRTICDKESLLEELEEVRKNGYALDDQEYHEHVRCLGVPVFNLRRQVLGVIGISSATKRFPKSRIPEIIKQVKTASSELSKQLSLYEKKSLT